MRKTEYLVDIQKQILFKQEEVHSNQKATEILAVEEVEICIFNNKIQKVFACNHETERESYLSPLSLDEIKLEWNIRYKQNISVDNEVYLEDFPGE